MLGGFYKDSLHSFPIYIRLEDMYNDGIVFSWNFLNNSWFIVWSGHERVRYGEAKFDAELDHLFGETNYYKIDV